MVELFGLTIWVFVAIVLFVLGLGIFRMNPLVGVIAGIGVFLVLLGVMLSAFGGVGLINNLLNNVWIQWLTIGSASYVMGTIVGTFF